MANLIEFLATWWWLPVLLLLLWPTYLGAIKVKRRRVEQRWLDDFHAGTFRGPYVLDQGMRLYSSPYGTEQRMVDDAQAAYLEQGASESVLLGPVSAWVAEGEAQAVRDWEAKHPTPQPQSDAKWVTLYHPGQGASHRVPNNPVVIADFATRGWVLPEPPADITGIKMTKIR